MKDPSPRFGKWFWLSAGMVLSFIASYGLLSAIAEAFSSGFVLVSSYGHGRPRQLVPWPHAWAYLTGLTLLLGAGLSVGAAAMGRSSFILPAVGLPLIGAVLMLFSAYLSTLRDTAFLICFFAAMASVFAVGRRFGKAVAVAYWAVVVGLFMYTYA